MLPGANFGTARRITATGSVAITSGNAYILGVLVNNTATGGVSLYAGGAGVTGQSTIGAMRTYTTVAATLQPAVYFPFPAYCSGGFSALPTPALDVDITIFWCPVGGP